MAGLREVKKQRTRDSIQREALRLIARQGYHGTTCEQIAAAAEVSPATLYRYFPSKEDIVLRDVFDPLIAEAVRIRPIRESALSAVRHGLAAALGDVAPGELEAVRKRAALVLSVPALRARSWEQLESLQAHLTAALAERAARRGERRDAEVAAAVCASVVGLAVRRWVAQGGNLARFVDEALEAIPGLVGGSGR